MPQTLCGSAGITPTFPDQGHRAVGADRLRRADFPESPRDPDPRSSVGERRPYEKRAVGAEAARAVVDVDPEGRSGTAQEPAAEVRRLQRNRTGGGPGPVAE